MELINATRMQVGYTMGLEPSGRELLVVVVKGTFRFPLADEPHDHFALHEKQRPLVTADTFTGEPGLSAPVYEVDFAPRKRRCDLLLLGRAHAPQGRPATRVDVGLRVGNWQKRLTAVGPRHWECTLAALRATPPEPFLSQPLSYDVAFGGTDQFHEEPAQHAAYTANPVGLGFHKHLRKEWVSGKPLPLTEETGHAVTDTNSAYRPMSFGPVGRSWEPRSGYAGTYDEAWLEKTFPFLPPDFDEQYFQAAPADQQVPLSAFSHGPTEVTLFNLTSEGITRFTIPALAVPVQVFPRRGERENYTATMDTVLIEPDLQRFTLNWRVARPLKRSMHEIDQLLVGNRVGGLWKQREEVAVQSPLQTV